jgi:hypothetical protein
MKKYKVYFQENTGTILAIANIDKDLPNFYETDYEDVAGFVEGTKSLLEHKVVYNITTSSYNIIPRESKVETLVSDLIYKITPREQYQLGVWKDKYGWIVSLSPEVQANLEQVKSRPNEQLTFSVTKHNNPNILYRHFRCSLHDLIEQASISFDFASQDEQELTNFSVYTNRKFDKYTCGVIDVENQSH